MKETVPSTTAPEDDQRIHDMGRAEAMAHAGNDERSKAAFNRQSAEIFDQYQQAVAEGDKETEDRARQSAYDLVGRYPGNIVEQYAWGEVLQEGRDIPAFEASILNEGRDTAERQDSEAERLEYWASALYNNPENDEDLTPQDAVEIENWVANTEAFLSRRDQVFEDASERIQNGRMSVSEAIDFHQEMFGSISVASSITEEWSRLMSNDKASEDEIRTTVIAHMKAASEGAHKKVAERKAFLESLAA